MVIDGCNSIQKLQKRGVVAIHIFFFYISLNDFTHPPSLRTETIANGLSFSLWWCAWTSGFKRKEEEEKKNRWQTKKAGHTGNVTIEGSIPFLLHSIAIFIIACIAAATDLNYDGRAYGTHTHTRTLWGASSSSKSTGGLRTCIYILLASSSSSFFFSLYIQSATASLTITKEKEKQGFPARLSAAIQCANLSLDELLFLCVCRERWRRETEKKRKSCLRLRRHPLSALSNSTVDLLPIMAQSPCINYHALIHVTRRVAIHVLILTLYAPLSLFTVITTRVCAHILIVKENRFQNTL